MGKGVDEGVDENKDIRMTLRRTIDFLVTGFWIFPQERIVIEIEMMLTEYIFVGVLTYRILVLSIPE